MSEQIQNHNLPTPEELQARDDAIFNTVEDFRRELDNPAQPQVPEFSDVAAHDAENKPVDVNAIFDARKAEINQPGTGRHRKAHSEEAEDAAAKAGIQYRAKRVAQQMAEGVVMQGLPKHRGHEEFAATAQASPDDIAAHRAGRNTQSNTAHEELSEGEAGEGIFDPAALAAAEEAARRSTTRPIGGPNTSAPVAPAAPEPAPATPTPTRGRHRGARRGFRPGTRVADDGRVVGNDGDNGPSTGVHVIGVNGGLVRRGDAPETTADTGSDSQLDNLNAMLDGDGDTTPDVVTPRARRRSGAAATGRLATMAAGPRTGTGRAASKAGEVAKNVSSAAKEFGTASKRIGGHALDLLYRKDKADLNEADRKARPYLRGIAVTAGALSVAVAVLGAQRLSEGGGMQETSTSSSASATPHASESAKPFGPQAPQTSETPTPSASATQKVTPKPTPKPTVGPTAIPTAPDFSNKPHVEEPQGPASSAEQQHTAENDHDSISFTTKDGKVVRATAKLKAGGSIFEAGHDAGLTDTQVANAVNKAGISSQRAEQLPVGQQIDFNQQADGSYVVHLR